MVDREESNDKTMKGFIAPIPTVFDGSGEPDLPVIEAMADFFVNAGVHGFFVLGSLGMGPVCTNEQRKLVAETVVRRVGGRVPVMVQVGAPEPYSSVELATHAEGIGADAIGVVGPYYFNNRTEWELIEHHRMIGNACGLPMLLYNNPLYSGYPCPPALMIKLREAVPHVFGAKLARGNPVDALRYLEALGPDFSAFIPIEVVVPAMQLGVAGSIAAGAVATTPELGVALIEACWRNDLAVAVQLQTLIIRHVQKQDYFWKTYGRSDYRIGWQLRGFDIKEYPRWPAPEIPAGDVDIYRANMDWVFSAASKILGKDIRLNGH